MSKFYAKFFDCIYCSVSSKTFMPAQKPILLNANHLFVRHRMFVTAKNVNRFLVCQKNLDQPKAFWEIGQGIPELESFHFDPKCYLNPKVFFLLWVPVLYVLSEVQISLLQIFLEHHTLFILCNMYVFQIHLIWYLLTFKKKISTLLQ